MVLITYLVSFDEIPWKKSLYILPLWEMADEYIFPFCGETNSNSWKLGVSYPAVYWSSCADVQLKSKTLCFDSVFSFVLFGFQYKIVQ